MEYCNDCALTNKDNNLCDKHYDILEKEQGRIMDKIYTVFVAFHAKDDKQAEKFVLDMQPSDWLDHLEEEE